MRILKDLDSGTTRIIRFFLTTFEVQTTVIKGPIASTLKVMLAFFCLILFSITEDARSDQPLGSKLGFEQAAYIKSSNPASFNQFGLSVAISANTMVVGAFSERGDSGAAYVFVREDDIWSQQARLNASNTDVDDHFGYSVAISGDTIVVGAYKEDGGDTGVNGDQGNQGGEIGFDAGAAYVFIRNGDEWSQQAYLKASNTGAGDRFGYSVGISGDTIVVGAYKEDSSTVGINGKQNDDLSNDAGAVYVFTRANSVWSQQAYIKASNTDVQDWFGYSLDILGDTLVVGAHFEDSVANGVNGEQDDNSKFNSGAAYIFNRFDDEWSQQAYLKASNGEAGDEFGYAVAISTNSVAVGAISESSNTTGVNGDQDDNSASNAGAVYVFTLADTSWSQQAYVKASNTNDYDEFGWSVDIQGDSLVVGASHEDSNAKGIDCGQLNNLSPFAGAVYAFTRKGTAWHQHAYLKASNTEQGDGFGWSVAIFGNTVVIGAPGEDGGASGVNGNHADNSKPLAGAAYVFHDQSPAQNFCINSGLNDAWYNPATTGQGFLISVLPSIRQMFVAWFTFDTERPPEDVEAILGEPGHRWLTAQGPYAGDTASLTIYVTEGGIFDAADPPANTDGIGDGSMTVEFADCTEGLVTYEIASPSVSGAIPIQRISEDNVALCKALSSQ